MKVEISEQTVLRRCCAEGVAPMNSPLLLSEGARLGGVYLKRGACIIEGLIECGRALMSFQQHWHTSLIPGTALASRPLQDL